MFTPNSPLLELTSIFSNFFSTKFGTMHPERFLKDVRNFSLGNNNQFDIEVKNEGKYKVIHYEA